jgi:hypothetical protein
VALDALDFRAISEFRRRHLAAPSALFVQVLKLCERVGLVKLGHVTSRLVHHHRHGRPRRCSPRSAVG